MLRTGRDGKRGFRLDTLFNRLLGNARRATDVLVAGVGARTDEAVFQFRRPAICFSRGLHLTDRRGQIWGEWSVQVRLQFAEVDFDYLVEVLFGIGVHLGVAGQVFLDAVGQDRKVLAAGRFKVALHARVVTKGRGGCADLCAHVADSALTGAAQ